MEFALRDVIPILRVYMPDIMASHSNFICRQSVLSRHSRAVSIMDEDGTVLMECSQPITVVKPSHASISQCQSSNAVAKCIDLKRSCSIYASMKLVKTCYKPTEPICAVITINNRSKGSLKYIHFNINQRVSYTAILGVTAYKRTLFKNIDLTGVGLPPSQQKILSGTSFSFSPQYHVPALVPSFEIPDCMKVDYEAKLTVGRSQNEIFGEITVSYIFHTFRLQA
uniref:Arrestin C-terminal-like domain-containing protein n=1 Tax=Parascaris univalens TaxID=6257 RepID=A0A914ZSU5_PARUN